MHVAKEKNKTAWSLGNELHVSNPSDVMPKGFTKCKSGLRKGLALNGSNRAIDLATTIETKVERRPMIMNPCLTLILGLLWNQKKISTKTNGVPFTQSFSIIWAIK
jgi:hypothetical protein